VHHHSSSSLVGPTDTSSCWMLLLPRQQLLLLPRQQLLLLHQRS
jgi:hypothetical protein